jgi:hypothetical protein
MLRGWNSGFKDINILWTTTSLKLNSVTSHYFSYTSCSCGSLQGKQKSQATETVVFLSLKEIPSGDCQFISPCQAPCLVLAVGYMPVTYDEAHNHQTTPADLCCSLSCKRGHQYLNEDYYSKLKIVYMFHEMTYVNKGNNSFTRAVPNYDADINFRIWRAAGKISLAKSISNKSIK